MSQPDECGRKEERRGEGRQEGGKHKVRKAREEEMFTLAGDFYVPDVMGY